MLCTQGIRADIGRILHELDDLKRVRTPCVPAVYPDMETYRIIGSSKGPICLDVESVEPG